jgi:hypothetical protein
MVDDVLLDGQGNFFYTRKYNDEITKKMSARMFFVALIVENCHLRRLNNADMRNSGLKVLRKIYQLYLLIFRTNLKRSLKFQESGLE